MLYIRCLDIMSLYSQTQLVQQCLVQMSKVKVRDQGQRPRSDTKVRHRGQTQRSDTKVGDKGRRQRSEAKVGGKGRRQRSEAKVGGKGRRQRSEAKVRGKGQRQRSEAKVRGKGQRQRSETKVGDRGQRQRLETEVRDLLNCIHAAPNSRAGQDLQEKTLDTSTLHRGPRRLKSSRLKSWTHKKHSFDKNLKYYFHFLGIILNINTPEFNKCCPTSSSTMNYFGTIF